jgi:hypothetical protein
MEGREGRRGLLPGEAAKSSAGVLGGGVLFDGSHD